MNCYGIVGLFDTLWILLATFQCAVMCFYGCVCVVICRYARIMYKNVLENLFLCF